jgi:molecular chaperone DnaK
VLEGQSPRADRNKLIGHLTVRGNDPRVTRDVPRGSKLEVAIEIDESRQVTVSAYIDLLDEEFDNILLLDAVAMGPDELRRLVEGELERLADIRRRAQSTHNEEALEVLARVDEEELPREVSANLTSAATSDVDRDTCCSRLTQLQLGLDEAEACLHWPELLASAQHEITSMEGLLRDHSDLAPMADAARSQIRRVLAAMEARDPTELEYQESQLRTIRYQALREIGVWDAALFRYLATQVHQMTNRGRADQLVARGMTILASGNVDGLDAINRDLLDMLPDTTRTAIQQGDVDRWAL